MSTRAGITITVHADKDLPPLEFLKKVLPAYPHAMGVSVIDKDGNLLVSRKKGLGESDVTVDAMTKLRSIFMSSAVVFNFQNDSTILEEDIMPYVMINGSKGNPLLVMYIEGNDFKQFEHKSSARPGEFFYAHGDDGPIAAVKQLYDMTDDKMPEKDRVAKVMAAMDTPRMKTIFIKAGMGRTCVTLHAISGQIYTFKEKLDDSFIQFENGVGWATKSHGWSPGQPAEPAKDKGILGSLMEGLGIGGKSVETRTEAPAKPALPPMPVRTKTDTAVPISAVASETVWVFTPSANMHGKSLKETYRKVFGGLPTKWKQRIPVPVTEAMVVSHPFMKSTFSQVNKDKAPKLSDIEIVEVDRKNFNKDVEPAQLPAATPEPAAPADPTPDSEEKKWVDLVIASVDKEGDKVVDPKLTEDQERKWPSWVKRTGHDIAVIHDMNMAARVALAKKYPELAAVALRDQAIEIKQLKETKKPALPPMPVKRSA